MIYVLVILFIIVLPLSIFGSYRLGLNLFELFFNDKQGFDLIVEKAFSWWKLDSKYSRDDYVKANRILGGWFAISSIPVFLVGSIIYTLISEMF